MFSMYFMQRSKQAVGPACLGQAQAVIFAPVTGQAGQAKTSDRPGRPLKIDRPPACRVFLNFQYKTSVFEQEMYL